MARHVILMRHGESEANARHLFQGAGSSPLTARGRAQAAKAGERLVGRRFAKVESSDLERSVDTAHLAGLEPLQRSAWREGDIGRWEGIPERLAQDSYAEEIARLHWDYDMRMGVTGESPRQVADRGCAALDDLVARLDDGETALVVAHGGLIGAVLWRLLDLPTGRRRLAQLSNTAFCELAFHDHGPALNRYNDAGHLGPVADWATYMRMQGAVVVDLIRHGVTHANLERRVQGRLDEGLHPDGRAQSRRLRDWIGEVDQVYSSPLSRATVTAETVFGQSAIPVEEVVEISLGEWEGRMWADLEAAGELGGYPDDGNDIRRGHTGETWSDVQQRVSGFVNRLQQIHPGGRVAVASHGGAIRAYTGSVLGFGFDKARLIGWVGNTAVTQVVVSTDGKPAMATYNLTTHLERVRAGLETTPHRVNAP